ncbi:hypothetical protein CFC21_047850 [Triticum aestivum]|uniref:TF-B3 domain-containing protein n=3 Tax=Triticinae TaxID=1648030 RepID=A0A9R1FZH9_WHEAT|nr:hypothetical protein CFC21_047850 [Triticum aestivum]
MCFVDGQTTRAGCKRPLMLAVREHEHHRAAAERAKRTNMSAVAGALVMYVAPAPPGQDEPVNAVPLAAASPRRSREAPDWIPKVLLPQLRLCADLTVTFIDEKAVTKSDLDPQQNRLRLRTDGVRRLLPLLTDDEAAAANLLYDQPRVRRASPMTPPEDDDAVQGRKGMKRLGRKHGGLPMHVVASSNLSIEIKQLELSRWDGSQGTVIKGAGYHDFIGKCGFREDDLVEIWAFKQREFRNFGVNMCDESPLYIVLVNKQTRRAAAARGVAVAGPAA